MADVKKYYHEFVKSAEMSKTINIREKDPFCIAVVGHGAKFVQLKRVAMQSRADLPIKNG